MERDGKKASIRWTENNKKTKHMRDKTESETATK